MCRIWTNFIIGGTSLTPSPLLDMTRYLVDFHASKLEILHISEKNIHKNFLRAPDPLAPPLVNVHTFDTFFQSAPCSCAISNCRDHFEMFRMLVFLTCHISSVLPGYYPVGILPSFLSTC